MRSRDGAASTPLLTTVHNNQTSGTSAMPKASQIRTVATLFLTLRDPRALAKVKPESGGAVMVVMCPDGNEDHPVRPWNG